MGIKFLCPNGHRLHVKSFLASQRGVCPQCGEKFLVPAQSLPDIRVESLGVKASKRAAVNALPSNAQSGSATLREAASTGRSRSSSSAAPIVAEVGPQAGLPEVALAGDVADLTVETAAAPETDPFAQAPGALWYVRIAAGEQFGPAQGDLMQRWLTEGRVAADSLVWREGWAEWMNAGRIFPQLSREIGPSAVLPGCFAAFEQGLAEHVESLVVPTQLAQDAPGTSDLSGAAQPTTSTILDARRPVTSYNRLILVAIVLGILSLLPVLVYVLWR